ncbi:MAG: DUF4876 domain-containing protein [Porphyromonadaceae bacterium]|nr:DUF4876 domain-containing protein [Porphyromonadaceae bacterium]
MKNGIFLPVILALGFGFTGLSCSDDDDNATKIYSLDVTVTLPEEISATDIGDLNFTATNAQTAAAYNLSIDAESSLTATFENLPAGTYTVKVEAEVSADSKLSGSASVQLYNDESITIDLNEVMASTLIFKEIYVSSYSYYFKDMYWEIVNNSDEVQYLDQCIIGHMDYTSSTSTAVWVDENGNSLEKYPLLDYVLAFPGNGTDYPLQPGESVVIAQDATDHSAVYDVCPDLSNADWEAYLTSSSYTDTDYPTDNMTVIYDVNASFYFCSGAFGQGIILAKLPEGVNATDYAANSENIMTMPNSSSTTPFLMIPRQYVLDAVQIADEDDVAAGELSQRSVLERDDAGYTWAYAWSGQCIRRKAINIENGRVYYQDTNNSTEDFLVNQPLTPGVAPTSIDAD